MRFHSGLLLCLLAVRVANAAEVAATPAAAPRPAGPAEIHVPHTTGAITIDGKTDEGDWSKAPRVVLRKVDGTEARAHTEVRLLHDDERLYVAFKADDPDIWTDHEIRDSRMWEEDVVEIFIDVDPTDPLYDEIEVNPKGTLFDVMMFEHRDRPLLSWNPAIQVGVQVDGTVNERDDKDRSWTVELSIPARDLAPMRWGRMRSAAITPGTTWRVELCRNESSKGLEDELQSWTPVPNDFHATNAYGRVVFD